MKNELKDMSIESLKALAYDLVVQVTRIQGNIAAINNELFLRESGNGKSHGESHNKNFESIEKE